MSQKPAADDVVSFWTSDSVSFPSNDIGLDVFVFYARMDKWIRRRVEKITFVDARTVRRQVSVDFELPLVPPLDKRMEPPVYLVPLALLHKEPLVGFDLRDEGGSSLPVLTKEENGFVTWSALASIATFISGPKTTRIPEPTRLNSSFPRTYSRSSV